MLFGCTKYIGIEGIPLITRFKTKAWSEDVSATGVY